MRRKSLAVILAVALTYVGLFVLEGAGSAAPTHVAAASTSVATPSVKAAVLTQVSITTVTAATQRLAQAESRLAPAAAKVNALTTVIAAKVGTTDPVSSQNVQAAVAAVHQLSPAQSAFLSQAQAVEAAAGAALTAPAADPLTVCNCSGARANVVRAQARLAASILKFEAAVAAVAPAIIHSIEVCAVSPGSKACATALRLVTKAQNAVTSTSTGLANSIQNLVNKEIALALCEAEEPLHTKCRNPS